MDDVGETGDLLVTLLDDGEGDDGHVVADDAAVDRLALALTGAAGAVAGVAVGEQQPDTAGVHDTLLHGETLLVVASGDAEDVALELVADGVTRDLSAHLQINIVLAKDDLGVDSCCFSPATQVLRRSRVLCVRVRTRFSRKTWVLRSSSMSKSFWLPLAGKEMFN